MKTETELGLYSWSSQREISSPLRTPQVHVEIDDETWRDGMQGTQTERHPDTEERREYLVFAGKNGFIEHADIGFPGSGIKHRNEMVNLINSLEEKKAGITLSAAGRGSAKDDIRAILEVSSRTGYPLEGDLFLDTSEIRAKVEGWDRTEKLKSLKDNISLLKKEGLPVMFVLERATTTSPKELYDPLMMAIDLGVDRICIADTQGIITPQGVSNIFRWVINEIGENNKDLKLDFHEHNDLGMGIANCLVAAAEGVDRLHATARGIGERAGNVNLEQLLVVLSAKGYRKTDVRKIRDFAEMSASMLGLEISKYEPIIGENSMETASGVHASAYGKSELHENLPPIYFPFDLKDTGSKAVVKIGPSGGIANVRIFCKNELGIEEISEEKAREILDDAQKNWGILSAERVQELLGIVS
jgi:2-isopropylmalate synthase